MMTLISYLQVVGASSSAQKAEWAIAPEQLIGSRSITRLMEHIPR